MVALCFGRAPFATWVAFPLQAQARHLGVSLLKMLPQLDVMSCTGLLTHCTVVLHMDFVLFCPYSTTSP